MSDEEYDKRENTLRTYVKKEREKNPNFKLFAKSDPNEVIEHKTDEELKIIEEETKKLFPVGSRCEVNPGGRRGEIKYVGKVGAKANGTMLGIALDEPQGMNDGTRSSIHYFECKGENYGVFSKPENVNVGDFPEEDPFAGLSDDEDEI